MIEFDKIHLVWRKGTGHRRVSVGILEKTPEGKHVFKYSPGIHTLYRISGFEQNLQWECC